MFYFSFTFTTHTVTVCDLIISKASEKSAISICPKLVPKIMCEMGIISQEDYMVKTFLHYFIVSFL